MKRVMTMAAAMALAAPALAASDAAWDQAARKTVWEIVHQNPGAAPASVPGKAVPPNRHFLCTAVQFFGALQIEVEEVPPPHRAYPDPNEKGTVRVRLQGIHAGRAAQSLGLADGDVLGVSFPADWCTLSSSRRGVVSCEIQDWKWPRPTLPVTVIDRGGQVVSKGTLAVYKLSLEAAHRISAGSGTDIEQDVIELDASMISETDNAKRAELRIEYRPGDCRDK